MKRIRLSLLLAAAFAVGMTAGAQEAETAATQEAVTEAGETKAEAAGTEVLSDSWSDFQIQIDDQVYAFPMTYGEFTGMGWSSDDVEGVELEPYQYGSFLFEKGKIRCRVYILNLAKNNLPAQECIVGGINIDSYDWELTEGTVTLPLGIVRGKADVEAIKAAYGTPSDTYEGDLYTELTYETDYNCCVEMSVYKESGALEEITVQNFVEPEGFDPGEASTEVPEAVSAYEKPSELSSDLTAYEILLDGQVYALPVPVSVLIADGWELDENDSEMEVVAGNSGWATLRRDGQEIRELVRNEEKYATIPQNCWVEELTVGGYTLEAEGMLPGGIVQGMPKDELIALLEDNGMDYEVEDNGDFIYINYNEKDYGQSMQAVVYHGDDGHFPQDTVMEITCSNTF